MSPCNCIRRRLLAAILVWLPITAAADWEMEWDVQVEDAELKQEIQTYLQDISQMFADAGFPSPYITDEECNAQTRVVIEDNRREPLGQDCWGTGIYHCRSYPLSDTCVNSSMRIRSDEYESISYENRVHAIATALFSSVMYSYDWYRENKPITDEGWFTWALPLAASHWVLEAEDELIDERRHYRSPLHAPLGYTALQSDQSEYDWDQQVHATWPIWTMIKDFFEYDFGQPYGWNTILSGALRDRWSYKDNHLFYLDLLDAGLHQMLVEACADDRGLLAVGGRDACTGLCGADKPLRIRYLDVEDEHPVEDYQVCADAVGGLYFLYAMLGSVLVDNMVRNKPENLEGMFHKWPSRNNYPSGCIPAILNREEFSNGRSYGEIKLSLEPVSMECIVVSGQSARPGPAIHITSPSEEIIDQLHLSYDTCGRRKLVTASGKNGPWTASWILDPANSSPGCSSEGDEKYLIISNVAKRASETVAAVDLTIKIYGASGEVN